MSHLLFCIFHYETFFNQHLPPTGSCNPSAMLLVACCTSISPDEYDVTSCVRSLTVSGETGVGNSADWLSGIVISSSGGGGGKSESGLGYISSETESIIISNSRLIYLSSGFFAKKSLKFNKSTASTA